MALDSSGNPQVEFVWGNMPLQGNTQRGVTAPVVKTTYNYQNDFFDGKGGMFAIDLASATEVKAGWVITATAGAAGYTQITKEFTVESVSMGSPGYYVRTKEAFDQAFRDAGMVGATYAFITSISPALNRGGGAGDKGWSKTTLVKSPLLDPTLDNHTLATSGWNGYPGYVPNVESLSLWEGTLAPSAYVNMTIQGTQINFEYADFMAGVNPLGKQGYIIKFAAPVADETVSALSALIDTDAIIGQSVNAFTAHLDYMGTAAVAEMPSGHIISASQVDDMYGNTVLFIVVHTGTLVPQPTSVGEPQTYTGSTQPIDLVIGAGQNKEIVFKGTNVNADFGSINTFPSNGKYVMDITTGTYGAPGSLSQDLLDVAATDLSGALVGFAFPLSPYGGYPQTGMNSQQTPYASFEIAASRATTDGYGNPEVIFDSTLSPDSVMVMGFYANRYDSMMNPTAITMYIVK